MREIKFRAVINKTTTIYFTLQDLARYPQKVSIRKLLIPWLRLGNKPDEYTGLQDKNGKEIYERDIVKHRGKKYQVCWNSIGWGSWGMKDETDLMCNRIYLGELEIIGNIHENLELLEEGK